MAPASHQTENELIPDYEQTKFDKWDTRNANTQKDANLGYYQESSYAQRIKR